jgi:hypothetical protein
LAASHQNKFEVLFNFEKNAKESIREATESKVKAQFVYDEIKADWVRYQAMADQTIGEFRHKVNLLDGKVKDQDFYIQALQKQLKEVEKEKGIGERLDLLEQRIS